MSADDRAEHKGEELKGTIKEGIGKLTGNHSLEAEGKGEKWAGKAKGAVDDVVEDLKDESSHR
jgi:uncharacterized protein YjbJ (UPF0337 family)